jgi:hypothetical protein
MGPPPHIYRQSHQFIVMKLDNAQAVAALKLWRMVAAVETRSWLNGWHLRAPVHVGKEELLEPPDDRRGRSIWRGMLYLWWQFVRDNIRFS